MCGLTCHSAPNPKAKVVVVNLLADHLAVAYLCLFTLLRAATMNPGRVPFSEDDFNNLGIAF